jgi:hypothetical protein
MSKSRFHLKALALCGMVVGLMMAFGSVSAQAEPEAHWWIVNLEGKLVELDATLGAELEKNDGSLLTKISGVSVQFLCTAQTLIGGILTKPGSSKKGAKVKYSGCTTKLNGTESKPCVPKNAGTEEGVIVTKGVHFLLILHLLKETGLTDHRILVLPDEGETFATIEMGKECSIGTKVPVIGPHLVLKDCENLLLVHLVTHLLEEDKELTELWTISKTEEHKATLDGSVLVFLTGEHKGLKWSGEF